MADEKKRPKNYVARVGLDFEGLKFGELKISSQAQKTGINFMKIVFPQINV